MTDAEVDASARRYYEAEYNYRAEEQEALANAAREVRAMRGRFAGRRRARGYARACRDIGILSRVIRYRRDRVWFDETMPGLEVNDSRWLP